MTTIDKGKLFILSVSLIYSLPTQRECVLPVITLIVFQDLKVRLPKNFATVKQNWTVNKFVNKDILV